MNATQAMIDATMKSLNTPMVKLGKNSSPVVVDINPPQMSREQMTKIIQMASEGRSK